jgi:hypothetical protein
MISAHGKCQMHLVAVNVGTLLKELHITNSMFCGCCLLQKGGTRRKLRESCHRQVAGITIDTSRDPPAELCEKIRFISGVLAQMDYTDDVTKASLQVIGAEDILHAEPSARHAARQRLAVLIGASIIVNGVVRELVHWCPLGCHDDPEAVIREVCAVLDVAFLFVGVGVPALNKWLKLFKPTAWWHAGVRLNFLTLAFIDLSEPQDATTDPMKEVEMFALGTELTYAKKRAKRTVKTKDWLVHPKTPLRLGVSTSLLTVVVTLMSDFFAESVFGYVGSGVLDFVLMDRNPVLKVVVRCPPAPRKSGLIYFVQ